ncbi:MAG: hypothetical protein ACK4IA_16565 [Paracoccus hibiscisoli]|uniref:hypothetical protein n=1 Tax=Paracoccus hibiscisoli TaxID=2023261 RepID=UPI003919A550
MKLKITKPGYHDQKGKPVEVGTVITVQGDTVPASLLNKCEVLDGDTKGKDWATGQNPGPTVEEYVAAGYRAENYPPQGFEPRSTPEEIAAAIEAQKAADEAAKKTKAKA